MAESMSIDNKPRDDSEGSLASTPDREQNGGPPSGHGAQDGQQPKRKGGRKPIYATSEERKQRNRQAQAAFRERRTEYIKQLEDTIHVHEQNLHNLQGAHRTAADECLMLRYKNSLLERILLEKGIDVQAELRAKTGSPNLGPTHMPQNLVQPPPIQRAIMNRHHQSRRSNSSIAPKSEPGVPNITLPPPIQQSHSTGASPKNRPTPSSHSDSPTNTGSAFSPAASDNMSMRGPGSVTGVPRQQMPQMSTLSQQQPPRQPMMQPQSQPQPPHQQHQPQPGPPMRGGPVGANTNASGASYYPTPAFQNHIEQLEQEYDTHVDMVDDSEIETPSGPGPYPAGFSTDGGQPAMLSPASSGPGQSGYHGQATNQQYPSMTQLLDQNLEWDPFGLSASMAFPAQQFQFDQQNMR